MRFGRALGCRRNQFGCASSLKKLTATSNRPPTLERPSLANAIGLNSMKTAPALLPDRRNEVAKRQKEAFLELLGLESHEPGILSSGPTVASSGAQPVSRASAWAANLCRCFRGR